MKNQNEQFDVIVIGGGASGMMAAGVAAENGARVLILEKNKNLGEKLKITGGGRCNVTNAEEDINAFLKFYGEGNKFLYSAFSQFDNKDTFKFFESKNLELKVEALKRTFPVTDKAADVFDVLEKILKEKKVVIKTGMQVLNIEKENGAVSSVGTKEGSFFAKNYILATGGQSHPETGSTGDGFKWLKILGHKVISPTPSIVPLAVKDRWIKSLSGKTLSSMRITFFVDGVKKFKKDGDILCTHFGISGPLILNSAKKVADLLHEGEVTALIDLHPKLDHGALEKHILQIFDNNKNKMLKNVFEEIVPKGTGSVILSLIPNLKEDTKVHSITKEERKKMVQLFKALPFTITGLMGFDRAVVADGGVALEEVDTKTMRSKLFPNLFVTGDLLHINRPSGGFSLQLCWTTGFVAGINVSKK